MKHWPVPNSFSKTLPADNSQGSFWEDRGDRHHCGVEIYAPEGSDVLSITPGKVVAIDVFTSPMRADHWNFTYFILIRDKAGFVYKYAELGEVKVKAGDFVKAGEIIGKVGLVLNPWKINETSPEYIKKLKDNPSMLHLELYGDYPEESEDYLGGNWFGAGKPQNLLNPANIWKI
jgi:murein DD-endopeptidase MepM/ murein hydrolase activator NlpD